MEAKVIYSGHMSQYFQNLDNSKDTFNQFIWGMWLTLLLSYFMDLQKRHLLTKVSLLQLHVLDTFAYFPVYQFTKKKH